MTKKIVALLLAVMLLLSLTVSSLAEENKSAFLSSLDMTAEEIMADATARAMGSWFAVLDAMAVLGSPMDDMDVTKDSYIGYCDASGGLEVYFARESEGHYCIMWFPGSNEVALYAFASDFDPATTEYVVKNDLEQMALVAQVIAENLNAAE